MIGKTNQYDHLSIQIFYAPLIIMLLAVNSHRLPEPPYGLIEDKLCYKAILPKRD